ncbi:transposase [Myxococcota bacterium]|nr:transposase [Myxococcota bacterium]
MHPVPELLTTAVVLAAMGRRDQDGGDTLRNDPAPRVAVSGRRGIAPLEPSPDGDDEPRVPGGLAPQPTLSRLVRMLSSGETRATLMEGLTVAAGRRIHAMNGGKHLRFATIDVDSFPFPVEGHQEGSEYSGHYAPL